MPKDMYVVKLSFSEYGDFAQWITSDDGSGTKRYKLQPGPLKGLIEAKLAGYPAKVHEFCDPNQPTRDFDNQDKIVAHRDKGAGAGNVTNMAMPDEICEDANGNIDLEYLRGYVNDIKNEPNIDAAALSLLGMYFLSRCR